jgi:SRSO17 transposase
MLERAFAAAVPARWVVADSFYGRSHAFRVWPEERGRPYAVMVPKTNAVPLGGRKKRIEQHVERLPEEAFSEVRPARDSSGRRPWEWACLELAADPEKGMRRWLLVRRSTDDPEDLGFYQAYGPEETPIEELVRVSARTAGRWRSASRRPWVARTGSSWREMPEEYGKWESAYRRHELWVKQGIWPRMLRALGEEDLPGPSTKKPN